MTGVKTNERPGTRAVAKYLRVSPYKVREVLDLIRGQHVQRASEILRFSERDAAFVVGKVLASAVANAENNDGLDPEDLYVSACYADEGVTIKRFRPRARGRAGRIRKRTCHVTVIVSRMDDEALRRYRTKQAAEQAARRARRVAGGRAAVTTAETGGRAGRLRRTRGGSSSTAEDESVATTDDEAQVEAVDEVAAAADEAGVVENSPETGPETDEVVEVAPEAASDEGAEGAEDEGRG